MSIAELATAAIHSQITLPLILQGMELEPAEAGSGIDLNDYLVRRPASTVLAHASDDSMLDCDIHCGDLLVVDRASPAQHGDIVLASVEDAIVCRKLDLKQGLLCTPDDDTPCYVLADYADLAIIGVVLHAIHALK